MFRVAVDEPFGPAKIRLNSRFAALLLAEPHDLFPEAVFNEHRLSPYDAVRCRNTRCHSYRRDAREPGACRSFRPAARAGAVSNVVRSCVVSIHRGQWCSLWLHCHSPASRPLVTRSLYILPEHQGQGIGATVLRDFFTSADAQGMPVRLGALRGSDSNRFYSRHGFVQTSEDEWDIYYARQPAERKASSKAPFNFIETGAVVSRSQTQL